MPSDSSLFLHETSLFPTRRRFLGMGAAAGAALTPLACATVPKPGSTPLPVAADAPADRKAGLQSPDVEALLSQMTVEEKIGQMTQADMKALKDGTEVRTFALGSVLSGADSLPKPNEPATWVEMYDRYQSQALATRLGIPMFYGVDAVHGHGAVKGATIFPHNIAMGCTNDPAIVEAAARVTAREVAGTGIDWNFAPCLAVARDERWGRTYESYGESPELVASLGAAAIRGFETATDGSAILATAKHFLADGGTLGGKDQGDARISEEELRRIHLPGYAAAIKAGVGSVMVSYSMWNGQHMHGNKHLITDVLKGELAFPGFVVTDWQAIDRMAPGDYSQAIDMAINAGIDMVMVPNAYRDFIARLKALVAAGRVPMARIDDSVRRILKQKVRFKMWEKPFTDRALTAAIGSQAHRDVARDAVRKSLVVLKNDKQTLPLRNAIARPPVRPAGRQHGHPVRRLVGRLARPARRHHAGHHHPQGDREGGRRGTPRLLGERGGRREGGRGGGGGGRGSLRRGERRSRQAGARAAGPGADRRGQAQRQAGGRGAALGAADHPGRRARRRERGGGRLAAGDRGRRRRGRAVRRVQADG